MLIVKLTPACLDTSCSFLVLLLVCWWLCRLCTAMKTLCDAEPCSCDYVGRVTCTCQPNGVQEVEISRDGVNRLIPTASSLYVRDCGTVRIRRKSLEQLSSLKRVTVVNVRNLTLEEHSFSWNDSTIYDAYPTDGLQVHVENSSVPTLPTYVFRGRIDSVTLVRATVGAVRAYAFTSLAGTKTLLFRDCHFRLFESQAFKKFTVEDTFSMVGGRVDAPLPSRTLLDVAVRNELQLSGVRFGRVRSSAVRVHGPRKFQIRDCHFERVDGEAFVVHGRGPVFVDDCRFEALETGAFAALTVERHEVELSGPQELVFKNNSIGDCGPAALLFNVNAFAPTLDWIRSEARCDCRTLRYWLTDVIAYSRRGRYPYDRVAAADVRADEIVSCWTGTAELPRRYARLKDYSLEYCGQPTSSAQLAAAVAAMAALLLVAVAVAYWIWYKHGRRRRRRRRRWLNVPQSSPAHEPAGTALHSEEQSTTADTLVEQPSPCYEEPSTSRRHIVFVDNYEYVDHRTAGSSGPAAPSAATLPAKETELRVIAGSPQRNRHLYANRMDERGAGCGRPPHEYSNSYAELNRGEYKYRVVPHRQHLLTSDL